MTQWNQVSQPGGPKEGRQKDWITKVDAFYKEKQLGKGHPSTVPGLEKFRAEDQICQSGEPYNMYELMDTGKAWWPELFSYVNANLSLLSQV